MKAGRFVMDTHVHAQRFAAGKKLKDMTAEKPVTNKWNNLSEAIREIVPYANTDRLFYDMECYGVDMCALLPGFGFTNALNAELVEKYPNKFVAFAGIDEYSKLVMEGEIEWTIQGVCDELDKHLSTGKFVGIGEQLPYMPQPYTPDNIISRETAIRNMLAIMEVCQHHNVVARYHTGAPMGYTVPYSYGSLGPANYNPLWAHDLANAFPDVPIIIDHGGMQGWWSERFVEESFHVAASHDNVYLETGLYWSELYEKALIDPNIGPEKLLWGTDWGASMGFHSQPGRYPESYGVQVRKKGPVTHQVDYWGWSLRELTRLRISQDDMNLILGGNAAHLFKIEMPHSRMFRSREI